MDFMRSPLGRVLGVAVTLLRPARGRRARRFAAAHPPRRPVLPGHRPAAVLRPAAAGPAWPAGFNGLPGSPAPDLFIRPERPTPLGVLQTGQRKRCNAPVRSGKKFPPATTPGWEGPARKNRI